MKNNITFFELTGSFVLLLVIIAMFSFPKEIPPEIQPLTIALCFFISILLVVSLLKLFKKYNYKLLLCLSIILLLTGGYVFYFFSDFFIISKNITNHFWYTVCIYSLPSICIEGGLMTLFTIYFENSQKSTSREKIITLGGFLLYAFIAISTNFLAIGDFIAIEHQVILTRAIVALTLSSLLFLFFLKRKNLHDS